MEPNLQTTADPKKMALTNGLIWAGINIAIFLVVYYVKPDLMGSWVFLVLSILIGVGLAIYFIRDIRTRIGGYWSFGQALGTIFIMFLTQALIVMFFTLIFGKYLEPEYVVKMKEISQATALSMMESMGADQETIDKTMEDMEAKSESQFNPGPTDIMLGVLYNAIGYFIGALIFAAIFKKESPRFAPIDEDEVQ